MSDTDNQLAMRAVLAIQADNCANMVADPAGQYPSCKNAVGTWICERCSNDVRELEGAACPSIPRKQRWRFNYAA